MRPFRLLALLSLAAASVSFAQTSSAYTSLQSQDCRAVSRDEATESAEDLCRGVGGYELLVQEGDLRQNIVVVRGAARTSLDLWSVVGSAFSLLGPRAEWRLQSGVPIALIVRYNLSDSSDPSRKISVLAVAKLGARPCVVANVEAGPRQNERARQLADTASTRRCLTSDDAVPGS